MQTAHLDPTAELSARKSSSRHKRQQLGSVSGSVCSERSAPLWERREEGVGQSAGGRFGVGARLVLGAELEVQATVGRVPHLCSHKHPRTQSPLRTHTHTHTDRQLCIDALERAVSSYRFTVHASTLGENMHVRKILINSRIFSRSHYNEF